MPFTWGDYVLPRSTHLHGEIARLHGVYMGRLGLEAMSLPLDWLLKAQKVPPLTNSIFL